MSTPLMGQSNGTAAPQLDRIVRTLEEERAKLKKIFTSLYAFASVLTVAGLFLAVAVNAFLPNGSVVISAVSAGILILAGIFALSAIGSQTKYIVKNRPLSEWKEVRKGLRNAGFRYGNHRAFFGKYLVFREQKGNSFAVVDKNKPFAPFVVQSDATLTLTLDGTIAFVGRVNEKNFQIRNFSVHPDYRYRVKKNRVYEQASLQIYNEANDGFQIRFDFRNRNRRQFIALIGYLC